MLKHGGGIGLLWNEYDESVPCLRDFARLSSESTLQSPRHSTQEWRLAFEGAPGWTVLKEAVFPHVQSASREQVVARITSSSVVAALPPADREWFAGRALEILDSHEDTRWASQILIPYKAQIFWSRYQT